MQKKRLGIFPNLGKENVCIALPEFIQLCKVCGICLIKISPYVSEINDVPVAIIAVWSVDASNRL